jgi:hypothetical protein
MKQSNEHRARSTIGRALATAAVALLCVAALGQPHPAYAGPHDGGRGGGGGGGGGFHGGGGGGGGGFHGGGGFNGGGFGGSHGGGFAGGGFGGSHGGGFHGGGGGGFGGGHGGGFHAGLGRFNGGGFYGGGFYGDYPSDGYSDYAQPSSATWYYCSDPAGYYPYVTQCYTDWQSVPAS